MKKVKNVEPFPYDYRIFCRKTGVVLPYKYSSVEECLIDATYYNYRNPTPWHFRYSPNVFCQTPTRLPPLSPFAYLKPYDRDRDRTLCMLRFPDAVPVGPEELAEAAKAFRKKPRSYKINRAAPDKTFVNSNPNKIKETFGIYPTTEENYLWYTNHLRFYRRVKTKAETVANIHHDLEYSDEYGPLVRRKRMKRNLPNTWDDIPVSAFKDRNCWKRFSKRRKQWKPVN